MALTMPRALEVAAEIKACSDAVKDAYYRVEQALKTNSHLAIDWGAVATPEYLTENAAGNLDTLEFSRQELSNAIGSLDAFRALMEATSFAHLGNLNHIADAKQ